MKSASKSAAPAAGRKASSPGKPATRAKAAGGASSKRSAQGGEKKTTGSKGSK